LLYTSDFEFLTAGSSKELGLNSAVIQAVVKQFVKSSSQHKKTANWRSYKKNLGWIPIKNSAISISDNTFKFNGIKFKFWKSREIQGKIQSASISQDSQNKWFINIVTDHTPDVYSGDGVVGIDLGCKDLLTLSNGNKYANHKYYRKYQSKLALAQKSKKKKLVRKFHKKIANSRKDYLHKISTQIANGNKIIILGDINSSNLAKNHKIAKSIYDCGWFLLKTLLGYKAIERGSVFELINESGTTRLCNICKVVDANSPKGFSGLKIREWKCSGCGTTHDRDVNASLNILSLGLERLANKRKSKICA
jgi:IS605 OrfB family transposase